MSVHGTSRRFAAVRQYSRSRGVKQTCEGHLSTDANHPKRTFSSEVSVPIRHAPEAPGEMMDEGAHFRWDEIRAGCQCVR
jgi:hypothetical protein